MIQLQVRSRELGYRYIVRDIDWCEVWTPDHVLIAEFYGQLVLAMLWEYIARADTTARFHQALASGERTNLPLFPVASYRGLTPEPDRAAPFRKPLSEARPVTPTEKAALRITRRSRRR